jgi:sialate O-acetylesterase
MLKSTVFLLFIVVSFSVKANIKLPNLVGDHMVLQRNQPIKLWGYGDPAEAVSISFSGKTFKTVTASNGKWAISLPAMKAGGPYGMTLTGKNTITLSDILIGDVWICSGQSNMEFNLRDALNAEHELKNANHPTIRLYHINKGIALTPVTDGPGNWNICTPEHAKYFPAIGYFFGKRITTDTKIPIGLINASWGGTVIESWISSEGLLTEPTFGKIAQQVAKFDTVAYNQRQRRLNETWVNEFNQKDEGFKNGKYVWATTDFSKAPTINLPTGWEFTGINDLWELDGIVWFNKEIELTNADLQTDAQLRLGVILNADQAFFNGEFIGKTGDSWGVERTYIVPKNVLKAGKNRITLRIENYGGDGGLMSKATLLYLKTAHQQLTLAGDWKYKIGYQLPTYNRPEKEISPNTLPTLMYNNMINPLTGFSIKGVLWYQGESNWARGYQYRELFPRMIKDWRQKFNAPTLPFLYVQLANFHRKSEQPGDSFWAEVREAQAMTLAIKNTGMVTAIDVGDSANIHPKNKQEVGRRLALLAEKTIYNLASDSVSASYQSFKGKGKSIVITFNNVYAGLRTTQGAPGNFQIAGADKVWHWATAKITGKNAIEVYSNDVKQPMAVRYAWEDNPAAANVINAKGFPLFPFRTDNWNGITFGKN